MEISGNSKRIKNINFYATFSLNLFYLHRILSLKEWESERERDEEKEDKWLKFIFPTFSGWVWKVCVCMWFVWDEHAGGGGEGQQVLIRLSYGWVDTKHCVMDSLTCFTSSWIFICLWIFSLSLSWKINRTKLRVK